MAKEPLTDPRFMLRELRFPAGSPIPAPATRLDVSLYRRARASQLRRDPPRAPPQLLEPQHRSHLVRFEHRFSPRQSRGDLRTCLDVHQSLLRCERGTSFRCRYRTSFTCRLTATLADGSRA